MSSNSRLPSLRLSATDLPCCTPGPHLPHSLTESCMYLLSSCSCRLCAGSCCSSKTFVTVFVSASVLFHQFSTDQVWPESGATLDLKKGFILWVNPGCVRNWTHCYFSLQLYSNTWHGHVKTTRQSRVVSVVAHLLLHCVSALSVLICIPRFKESQGSEQGGEITAQTGMWSPYIDALRMETDEKMINIKSSRYRKRACDFVQIQRCDCNKPVAAIWKMLCQILPWTPHKQLWACCRLLNVILFPFKLKFIQPNIVTFSSMLAITGLAVFKLEHVL